ncbi:MAG: PfkB family carbohydrate kinase [Flavihumibacter sp.]
MTDFEQLFNSFRSMKVAVVGDVMLDTYWWGHVDRISPEAPVPVVLLDKSEWRIGGAGNVALNLAAMGAQTSIFSVLGDDADGRKLEQLLAENKIDTGHIVFSSERKTTNKVRVISRNQQMMRLDNETTKDLAPAIETALLERVKAYITKEKPAVLIFEDYNKGVLTASLIASIIARCREQGVITTVDPKKKNFFAYRQVDIFKPNLKEVKEGLNILLETTDEESLLQVHRQLAEKLDHRISFITLSEKGVFYGSAGQAGIIPSHIRNIADVSGAGDTVIALASLVYAATRNLPLFAAVANIAGGLVCEEVGTAAINKERLLRECQLLLTAY